MTTKVVVPAPGWITLSRGEGSVPVTLATSEIAEVVKWKSEDWTLITMKGRKEHCVNHPEKDVLAHLGLPAVRVAVPREPSKDQAFLSASLYPYVSDDDVGCDRREFLSYVRDRIDMDLQTGEY